MSAEEVIAVDAAAQEIAQQFVVFVRSLLEKLGLVSHEGQAHIREAVEIQADETEIGSPDFSRRAWDARARDWPAVESPYNYYLTMLTLLQYLEFHKHRIAEKVVSLGSGPGVYETYLGLLWSRISDFSGKRLICVDSSEAMVSLHQRILRLVRTYDGSSLLNVQPVVGDMLKLGLDNGSVDQILCNNSLQWSHDWRQAIREMGRVMRPNGLGMLYLIVHNHPMVVKDRHGNTLLCLGEFTVDELLDALEQSRFEIHNLRQILGIQGTGQAGTSISRIFIRAQFRSRGGFASWRHKQASGKATLIKP